MSYIINTVSVPWVNKIAEKHRKFVEVIYLIKYVNTIPATLKLKLLHIKSDLMYSV